MPWPMLLEEAGNMGHVGIDEAIEECDISTNDEFTCRLHDLRCSSSSSHTWYNIHSIVSHAEHEAESGLERLSGRMLFSVFFQPS